MTVPSQEAQEALLRQACRDAGVAPATIQYVEAHGTGTLVGDPIEARALGRVLSDGRPGDQPCLIGSVKTNIGHLEAGAGIAGLIKAALALHHRRIPGNLHFDRPNPEIDFDALRLRVPTRCEPWPAGDGPALAGVNAFGFGGTNAHVILQEAPHAPERPRASEFAQSRDAVVARRSSTRWERRRSGRSEGVTTVPGSYPCRPAVPRRSERRPGRGRSSSRSARTTSRSKRSPPTPRCAAPITITAWRSWPARSRSWRSA